MVDVIKFAPTKVFTFIVLALAVAIRRVDMEKVLSVRNGKLTVEVDILGTVKIDPSIVENLT